jgi:hypothetical protein
MPVLKGRGELHKLSAIVRVIKKGNFVMKGYKYLKEELCALTIDVLESLLGTSSLLGTFRVALPIIRTWKH